MPIVAKKVAMGIFVLAVICLAPRLAGQTGNTGSISVTVEDPTGAVAPDVVLELRDLGTNSIRKGVTTQSGAYTFANLPFGLYQLSTSAKGFQREISDSVQVQTARATEINAALRLGGTTETVEVSGAAPLRETASSVIATTIDTQQVVNLPIQGRSALNLAFTIPGFSATPLAVVSQTTLSQWFRSVRPLPNNKLAGEVIGGWALGTITTFQTGTPVVLNGGYLTLNETDPGVVFENGLTTAEVQSSMGCITREVRGPVSSIRNTSPPTGRRISTPSRPRARRGSSNIIHFCTGPVTTGPPTAGVQSLSFGQTTGGPTGPLEFRVNLEF